MKLIAVAFLMLVFQNAQANFMCSSVFETSPKVEKAKKLETETQNGKPRYFSVRNFGHFKNGELDRYLKTIHNLTQFSEKIAEVNSYLPERDSLPAEAFYVANRIIPLIEDYLSAHNVKYRIETYETADVKRSLVVIDEVGNNSLNELSRQLWDHGRVSLVINPVELFYGFGEYTKTTGRFFEIDAFNSAYAMSLRLLMHSQRKDFKMTELSIGDRELENRLVEIKVDEIQAGPKEEAIAEAQSKQDEIFADSRAKAKAHIDELIQKARESNKKGSSKN